MFILGLTGSIGMGKSSAAAMLRRLRLPLHDADAAVHRLLGPGGAAVAEVARAFPGVERNGGIDRKALGEKVFDDPEALVRLEAILHPLVRARTLAFLARHAHRGHRLVVLDIPLLYESGGERLCDAVLLVSAPAFLQAQRVLARTDMTPARFAAIRAKQMPDHEKRRRAEFLILTGLDKGRTFRELRRAVSAVQKRRGRAWSPQARRRSQQRK